MIRFSSSAKAINGVFAVPKDSSNDRLIIDARNCNKMFLKPEKVELPGPDYTSRLAADRPFFVAKVDLADFYHRIRLPSWMHEYLALPPLTENELSELGVSADCQYPLLTTLPMGWSHSVLVAQRAHLELIRRSGLIPESSFVCSGNDFRLDRLRVQVYIDDVIFYGPDSSEIARVQDDYCNLVDAAGLPHKPSKRFAPTADGLLCLGLLVHGRRRTVGMDPRALRMLSLETEKLIHRGFCSGLELASLVGRWSWAFLVSRPAFSVFRSVYRFIRVANRRRFRLWDSVARELQVASGLAPLLVADLAQEFHPTVVATDASSTGLGVVALDSSASTVRELVTSSGASLSSPGELPSRLRHARQRTIVSSRWQTREHINVLEMRAVFTALRWVVSRPSAFGSRVLLLTDSMVVAFAIRKGRSSSFPLLRLLRSLAAIQLASSVRLVVNWVGTTQNPADLASRKFV
jgi:hypothetical protein